MRRTIHSKGHNNHKIWLLLGVGLAGFLSTAAFPASAHGGFIVLSGNVQVLSPPFSPPLDLRQDQTESNTFVRAFNEQARLVLNQGVTVDFDNPGVYNPFHLPSPKPVIAAGTPFATAFFHVDPVAQSVQTYTFAVQFDQDIIGVQLLRLTREVGDALVGRSDVIYPLAGNNGLDDPPDLIVEFLDRRTLLVNLISGPFQDNFRVFTAVPEPASILLGAVGVVAFGALGLRRRFLGKPAG